MDARGTIVMLCVLFAGAFGWQMALFVPPSEYAFAGWIVAGVGTLITTFAATKGGA